MTDSMNRWADGDPADVLAGLLVAHPDAPVVNFSADGWIVPTPEGICTDGRPAPVGAHGMDLVMETDHGLVLQAWQRVIAHGSSDVVVRSTPDGDVVRLYFLDVRDAYGTIVCVVAPESLVAPGERNSFAPIPSRVGRMWRDGLGVVIDADDAAASLLGWEKHEIIGQRSLALIHPDDAERATNAFIELLTRPGGSSRARMRYVTKDGGTRWFESTHQNHLPDPEIRAVVSELMDISEEMAALDAVRATERRFRLLSESLPVGVLHCGCDGAVQYASPPFLHLIGVEELVSREEFEALVHPDDQPALRWAFEEAVRLDSAVDAEVRVPSGHGGQVRHLGVVVRAMRDTAGTADGDGRATDDGVIAVVTDITRQVEERQDLERRATVDPLTGCWNRATIMSILEQRLRAALRSGQLIAVAYLDLDGFKGVNDTLGHAAGDVLLQTCAERLRRGVRSGDAVGRLGGDEFVVVLEGFSDIDVLPIAVERMVATVNGPVVLDDGASAMLLASIGVASGGPGVTAADLVSAADAAMYEAKRSGLGQPVVRSAQPV